MFPLWGADETGHPPSWCATQGAGAHAVVLGVLVGTSEEARQLQVPGFVSQENPTADPSYGSK